MDVKDVFPISFFQLITVFEGVELQKKSVISAGCNNKGAMQFSDANAFKVEIKQICICFPPALFF